MRACFGVIIICLIVVAGGVFSYPHFALADPQIDQAISKTQQTLLVTGKAKEVEIKGEKVFVIILPPKEKENQAEARVKNILKITGKLGTLKHSSNLNGACSFSV